MLKWLIAVFLFFSIVASFAPVRPVPKETWTISPDGRTASVTGRETQPMWKKFNPVWWFLNDDEPDPPDWHLAGKPYLIRQLSWYARNPFQNFGKYILGVSDRNYTVVGTRPIYVTNWSDISPEKKGWKVSTIHIQGLRLPFVAYENEHVLWYAGWQWWGFFGFKFKIKNSPIQFW
jgi:hypothetical protein